MEKYSDLSKILMKFDPFTHPDKIWKQIFEDPNARIIFSGYRLNHIIGEEGLNVLKNESLLIADEIKGNKLKLENATLKERLKEMYRKIEYFDSGLPNFGPVKSINDQFVNYLLEYLKGEKPFGYQKE